MSATASADAAAAAPAPAPEAPAPVLPVPEPLEEDDEFEEFREETWGDDKVSKDVAEQWAADWDDEEADTDFDSFLRQELAKSAAAAGQ